MEELCWRVRELHPTLRARARLVPALGPDGPPFVIVLGFAMDRCTSSNPQRPIASFTIPITQNDAFSDGTRVPESKPFDLGPENESIVLEWANLP